VEEVQKGFLMNLKIATGSSPKEESENSLVERAAKGDKDAYQVLVEKYQQKVFSLIFSMVKSREDAEDISQEAFVKAYLSLKNFRGDSSFYTWVYRVAFNMTIDFKRKVGRRGEVLSNSQEKNVGDINLGKNGSFIDGPSSKLADPYENFERKQLSSAIDNAMAKLSDEHRAVIMLREVDGMSYTEIADITGITKGTVMSRIHYAKRRLQKALKELAPAGACAIEGDEDNGMEN